MQNRMGKILIFLVGMWALGIHGMQEARSAPVVSNVSAEQRMDGSGIVEIYYTLSGGVGKIDVRVEVSTDGGTAWNLTPRPEFLNGAVGNNVSAGINHYIEWDMAQDQPGVCWKQTRFRVVAVDEEPDPEITLLLPGNVPMVLLYVPPGTFNMGRNPGEQDSETLEDPQHPTTLTRGFYLGKYEVFQLQWNALRSENPSSFKGDALPVEQVSWNQAQEFLSALNAHLQNTEKRTVSVRLPTEAEWEYACRAGSTTRFYWGDDLNYTQIDEYAWYVDNSGDATHAVGGRRSNAWGFHDMSGNVWEWCQDWYAAYGAGPVTDPAGPVSGQYRVMRGGTWMRYGKYCRSAQRNYYAPAQCHPTTGFRIAAEVVFP